jgi:hypothetical protein
LYENGNKIEFHIGPNAYASSTLLFSEQLGLIHKELNTTTGNSPSPTGTLISGMYINNIPSEGTIYTFTPLF